MKEVTQTELVGIATCLVRQRRIEAIKRVRDITNLGIRESKDIVDSVATESFMYSSRDIPNITERLRSELSKRSIQCEGDDGNVVLDSKTLETLININVKVLNEIKEMNELLRDVLEAME